MEKSFFKEFLDFNKMVTPAIIKVLYYISLAVVAIVSLGMISKGMSMRYGGGFQVFFGIVMLVVSPLFIRMYFEILIVVFKIHERLTNIDNRQQENNL